MSRFKEILLLTIPLVLSTACQQSSHFSALPYLQSMSRHSVDICFQIPFFPAIGNHEDRLSEFPVCSHA